MEHPTAGILRRSSDAIVIIGLADGRVLDVNEAFFTATGHARHELMGRQGRDFFIGLGKTVDPTAVEALQKLSSLTDVPVGVWDRSGELRVAELSALVLEFEGRRDALCMIRGVGDPTPGQRRLAARRELDRILSSDNTGSEAATRALKAVGGCLRWELGVLWRVAKRSDDLRCAAVWQSPQARFGRLQELARHIVPPGRVPLRRVLLSGEPMWIPDVLADSGFPQAPGGAGEPMHGWLGFPALGADGVIGVVELISRETRQPDPELLEVVEDFGHSFGQLLEDAQVPEVRLDDEVEPGQPVPDEPPPGAVSTAFRDLAGAVAAATEALERQTSVPGPVSSPALLDELTAGMGKLNRLLQAAVQGSVSEPPALEPSAPSPGPTVPKVPAALPIGLTLKAVSRRTGIPAATLRTWEHRYKFLRPKRSPSGYRLYGEEEIARIEQVKYLVGEGLRVGAAMKAVIEEADGTEPTGETPQSADQSSSGQYRKNAEVYRLTPRSPRGRRP